MCLICSLDPHKEIDNDVYLKKSLKYLFFKKYLFFFRIEIEPFIHTLHLSK